MGGGCHGCLAREERIKVAREDTAIAPGGGTGEAKVTGELQELEEL